MLIWLGLLLSAGSLGLSYSAPALSFGASALNYTAWLMLAPLLIALHRLPRKKALLAAFFYGTVVYLVQSYWLLYITVVTVKLMLLALFSLAFFEGLFYLLFAYLYLAILKDKKTGLKVFKAAALFTAVDFLRMSGLLGDPFGGLASTQIDPLLLAPAAFIGAFGLSFLMVAVNFFAADIYLSKGLKDKFRSFAAVILVISLVLAFGKWAGTDIKNKMNGGKEQSVITIQPNIGQNEKLAPERLRANTEKLLALTRSASSPPGAIIIWPETAAPLILEDDELLMGQLKAIAKYREAELIIGSLAREGEKFYNSAYYLDDQGQISDRYEKVKLVTFGEFLPFRPVLEPTGIFNYSVDDLSPGSEMTVFKGRGGRFSVMICFESIPAWPARNMTDSGAELLFVITNDGWFGRSAELWQHLSQTRLRAIENGRYIVQASNTGYTAFIAPDGRILKRGAVMKEEFLQDDVKYLSHRTFFTGYGFYLAYLNLAYAGYFIFSSLRQKRQRKGSSGPGSGNKVR